ncbi:unnamed protein product [Lepeophtheirus salmonis]|uniref:(salmon louse) hypothetical protein n=1 Tax=Lepeophtheirus salmonis TaxID=72036 RepID=A0A7R8HB50_LEPSM|nr:unnamed protein product [Lepeophtheirus salmonis]CAF2968435.1 unnamed protein product [Lepeophtheirus salmonis]
MKHFDFISVTIMEMIPLDYGFPNYGIRTPGEGYVDGDEILQGIEITEHGQSFKYSALRTNPMYIMTYTMWYRFFATAAIPFGLTLFFNTQVLIYCRKNNLQTQSNHERSLLIIFACITITFLVCHIPRVILNIYEFTLQRRETICHKKYMSKFNPPVIILIATSVEKILLILNSSANFVYYCFSGNRFRNQFCQIVKCTYMNKAIIVSQSDKNSKKLQNTSSSLRLSNKQRHSTRNHYQYNDDMDRIKRFTLSREDISGSTRDDTVHTEVAHVNGQNLDIALKEEQLKIFLGQHYDEILI